MKRNIAMMIHELKEGGAERVVSNLSLHLPEYFRRYLIIYDQDSIEYPFKGEVIGLSSKPGFTPIGKIRNFVYRVHRIGRIKKEYHIEKTISFLEGPNLVNILSRQQDKVIVSVRNFISESARGGYGFINKFLMRVLYNRADTIISVSKAIRDDLITNYGIIPDKIKVVYNPYDLSSIRELANRKIEESYRDIFTHPVFISVGRLTRQKGQWHLIRAFRKVKEECPEAKLLILGQGEMREYLTEMIRSLGLVQHVFLLGFQDNPFRFVSHSLAYICSSLYEGFPNALVEAMACGVPVISVDCKSGPREILSPDSSCSVQTQNVEYAPFGILTPVCDGAYYKAKDSLTQQEDMLAQCMVELYHSSELREHYRQMALKRAQCFSIERIVKDYEEILK